uniref:Uncharacterized protein n=1 Tax=Anguilla anguilla TaxID=7936 RepID=A0A0E9SJS0_ANGAN
MKAPFLHSYQALNIIELTFIFIIS